MLFCRFKQLGYSVVSINGRILDGVFVKLVKIWPLCFILIPLVASTTLAASSVYKTIDKNGRVIYSDSPSKGAKLHHLKETPTIPALSLPPQYDQATPSIQGVEQNIEQESLDIPVITTPPQIKILYPKNQSHILIEQSGNIRIETTLNQPLPDGHKIVLYRNGEKLMQARDKVFLLQNQYRGEHQYTVQILNPKGEVISSDSVTLFVQRGRISRPAN